MDGMKYLWHTKPVTSIVLCPFDFHMLHSTFNDLSDAKSKIQMMQRSILRRPHVIIHHSHHGIFQHVPSPWPGNLCQMKQSWKTTSWWGGYKCKTTGSLMMFHVANRIIKPAQVMYVIAMLIKKHTIIFDETKKHVRTTRSKPKLANVCLDRNGLPSSTRKRQECRLYLYLHKDRPSLLTSEPNLNLFVLLQYIYPALAGSTNFWMFHKQKPKAWNIYKPTGLGLIELVNAYLLTIDWYCWWQPEIRRIAPIEGGW